MRSILITGGAGFIPSSLAEKLSLQGNKVVLVDNMLTGKRKNIPENENVIFHYCDVNDESEISKIFDQYSFDYVFHYAAVVGVTRTLQNPVDVLNDIQGIKNILNLCIRNGVKRIFYSSSSEVYGEPVELPQNEFTTPLNSRLPYAIVKNVGEAFCKSYHKEFNLNYTIFRFFNTYGPKQSKDFVMSKFIHAALENEDITIYGDGNQSRTFCYITDNLDATIKCMTDELFVNDCINIGSDIETSILDLAKTIIEKSGSKSKIIHLPPLTEGDMSRRMPDNSKMKNILNRELIPMEKGMDSLLKVWS